jgi:hypothetical protein
MIRKFNGNHAIKGRIQWQMQMFCNSGAITFEKGAKRNTCIIIVDESKISPKRELDYLYSHLIPKGREITGE